MYWVWIVGYWFPLSILYSIIHLHKWYSANGPLAKIIATLRDATPDERAKLLEKDTTLAEIHQKSSVEGQTAAPSREEDVDLHFICLAIKDGCMYEFDGRKPFPINHGPAEDVLRDGVKVVQKFMEINPDNLQYTIVSLGPNVDE